MPGTRSQDNQLEEFVDNPKNLGRKKTKMMETPRNDDNTGEGATENEAPTPTLYLPDMKNTTLTCNVGIYVTYFLLIHTGV